MAAEQLLADIEHAPNRAFEHIVKLAVPVLLAKAREVDAQSHKLENMAIALQDAFCVGFTKEYYSGGRFDMARFISDVEAKRDGLVEVQRRETEREQLSKQIRKQLESERTESKAPMDTDH